MTEPPGAGASHNRTAPVAVLVNPRAGRGRYRGVLPTVLDRLRGGGREITVLDADGPAQALAACRATVAGGAAALVTVGGDGTLNIGLQAVAGAKVPFGAVPAGTGNDFAVNAGLPADPVAAAEAIAAGLRSGRTTTVDLARMVAADGEIRWFGGVLGAGFDAIVNERANRMRFPSGPRRYDVAIVAELLRLRARRYTITLDDRVIETDSVLVAVGNTCSYGGGMRICPAADPHDDLLDVVVADTLSRAELMRIKPRVYQGTHVDHPKVHVYRAHTVGLSAAGIVAYVDGERAAALPVTVTSVTGALTLLGVAPAG